MALRGAYLTLHRRADAYLARHGTPKTPDALDGHQMVGFISSRTGDVLPLEGVTEAV